MVSFSTVADYVNNTCCLSSYEQELMGYVKTLIDTNPAFAYFDANSYSSFDDFNSIMEKDLDLYCYIPGFEFMSPKGCSEDYKP